MSSGVSDHEPSLAAAIFDALPVAAGVHDKYTLLAGNAAMRQLVGAQADDDIVGLPVTRLVHPDGRAAGEVRRALMFESGHQFHGITVKLRDLAGEPFTATGSGVTFTRGEGPVAIVVACEETTPTSLTPGVSVPPPSYGANVPLSVAVLDAFPLPVILVRDNVLAYANRSVAALLHARRPEELVGRSVFEFVHQESMDTTREQFALAIARGAELNGAMKLKGIDGQAIAARGSCKAMDHAGEGYIILVVTDVLN